jgi:hypothetical protein
MNEAKQLLVEAGLDNSHWGKRIIIAGDRGWFTDDENEMAGSWVTCACGKLDDGIDRQRCGEPADDRLGRLGFRFNEYVDHDYYLAAAQCLIDIEHRAIEVLNEQQNNEELK